MSKLQVLIVNSLTMDAANVTVKGIVAKYVKLDGLM